MSRIRRVLLVSAAMLVLASCRDQPPSAVEMYERVFGQARPASVRSIQHESGQGRDGMLRLVFTTSDVELAEKLAESLSLVEVEEMQWGLLTSSYPAWW